MWDDLLIKCAKKNKRLIISTGMADINEINHAVEILKSNGCMNPEILHCCSAYPTPYNECNLTAIETIRNSTGCQVGWSDHTVEKSIINRAINRWNASIIELHVDLDDGKGSEYSEHCWLMSEAKELINESKKGILGDGNGIKKPSKSEISDRQWRADPSDGLRPLKKLRANFSPNE